MKRSQSSAVFAALAALLAVVPAVQGGDIYTWTDEDGIVHYGDRPSGAESERVIHLASESTSPAPTPAPAATPATAPAANAAAAPEKKELTEAEKRAEQQERAKQCEMYKERLHTYLTSRRLYREENGERVYLSEEETLAARAKVQEKIVEFCKN